MLNDAAIHIEDLQKTFAVPVREAGLKAALKSLVNRRTRNVEAVKPISFDIQPGEVVGFLGPNGAGKTTTIKMLSGLLHPTAGRVSVMGYEPQNRQPDFLSRITLVMGQRNQMMWDIPVIDSFERNRVIYDVPTGQYRDTLANLTSMLELEELLEKPVRNLSLGERMKCEVAVALLHQPRVLFLDEPTIGLDVSMQRKLRAFISDYNITTGATVLLTSHYMADVEALCKRVIVIHHGEILFDGELSHLIDQFTAYKTINIKADLINQDLAQYGEIISQTENTATLRIKRGDAPAITANLLNNLPLTDLTVEDPPIEEVIDRVFSSSEQET